MTKSLTSEQMRADGMIDKGFPICEIIGRHPITASIANFKAPGGAFGPGACYLGVADVPPRALLFSVASVSHIQRATQCEVARVNADGLFPCRLKCRSMFPSLNKSARFTSSPCGQRLTSKASRNRCSLRSSPGNVSLVDATNPLRPGPQVVCSSKVPYPIHGRGEFLPVVLQSPSLAEYCHTTQSARTQETTGEAVRTDLTRAGIQLIIGYAELTDGDDESL